MLRKIAAIQSFLFAAAAFACWPGPVLAADREAQAARADIVGEVIAAIGEGQILSAAAQPQTAARGAHVRAGDRVETAMGGHVHIRFVDGGLVSVRPMSRLLIEAYRNGDERGLAAIKFRLEDGVMRSVTGAWGEAHRDRYRLNTPVAAIGIKGTDFVVKAARDATAATVFSGAIVMAPLEGVCAQTLGACSGSTAVTLGADMPGMMLELQRHNSNAIPRLVPAVDLLASGRADAAGQRGGESTALTGIVEKLPVGDSGAASQLAESVAGVPQTVSKPLLWLHNVFDWNVPENSISQRYDAALAAGRQAVVGNFFMTLYRDETVVTVFQPVGATASLALRDASATYTQPIAYGRPVENVAISGATLDVDFARSTFATRMDLASPSLGRTEFAASGAIGKDGVFLGQQTGQSLAGAFSTDGREAGYQFNKTLPGGNVGGLTLWGR